jgi:hypothetical protein
MVYWCSLFRDGRVRGDYFPVERGRELTGKDGRAYFPARLVQELTSSEELGSGDAIKYQPKVTQKMWQV